MRPERSFNLAEELPISNRITDGVERVDASISATIGLGSAFCLIPVTEQDAEYVRL
jgi:hypothetical protein